MENQEVEKIKSSKWEFNLILLQSLCLILAIIISLGTAFGDSQNPSYVPKFFIFLILISPIFSISLYIKYHYYNGSKKYDVFALIGSFILPIIILLIMNINRILIH
jgi:hypothetical protein